MIITADDRQTCNTPCRRRGLLRSTRVECFLACLSVRPCPGAPDNTSHFNEPLCLIVKQAQLVWFTEELRFHNKSARTSHQAEWIRPTAFSLHFWKLNMFFLPDSLSLSERQTCKCSITQEPWWSCSQAHHCWSTPPLVMEVSPLNWRGYQLSGLREGRGGHLWPPLKKNMVRVACFRGRENDRRARGGPWSLNLCCERCHPGDRLRWII